jgi:hypothetical protein
MASQAALFWPLLQPRNRLVAQAHGEFRWLETTHFSRALGQIRRAQRSNKTDHFTDNSI